MSEKRLYPQYPLMNADILAEYDIDHLAYRGVRLPEKLMLYAFVCMLHPHRVLEIGISRGHSTAWIARGLADHCSMGIDPKRHKAGAKLVAVDNWSKDGGGWADGPDPTIQRLKDTNLSKYVEIVSSDSQKYMKEQSDNSFDMIWIDGNHAEEAVRADIHEARRLTKGIIIVHDICSPEVPGVRKVCTEIGGGVFLDGERGMWIHMGDLT